MRDVKHILEEYKQGNMETRMNLYLLYRHVRGEFTNIEKIEEESMKTKEVGGDSHQKSEDLL